MQISELKNLGLGIKIDDIEVDATDVIERAFFGNHTCNDYRNESIDYMVKNKIDFHSTCNSIFNVTKRFIKIVCPTCKRNMVYISGGGSADSFHHSYRCEHCQTQADLSIPSEGFRVIFKHEIDG